MAAEAGAAAFRVRFALEGFHSSIASCGGAADALFPAGAGSGSAGAAGGSIGATGVAAASGGAAFLSSSARTGPSSAVGFLRGAAFFLAVVAGLAALDVFEVLDAVVRGLAAVRRLGVFFASWTGCSSSSGCVAGSVIK